jgi:hypothetical protein
MRDQRKWKDISVRKRLKHPHDFKGLNQSQLD